MKILNKISTKWLWTDNDIYVEQNISRFRSEVLIIIIIIMSVVHKIGFGTWDRRTWYIRDSYLLKLQKRLPRTLSRYALLMFTL